MFIDQARSLLAKMVEGVNNVGHRERQVVQARSVALDESADRAVGAQRGD